ncbi:MAG TPA: GntR family transcriptional regulator [Ktedonobacterales bacterium]|jgi:DNA-binding transcriptional regulator YhcF (GntR family)
MNTHEEQGADTATIQLDDASLLPKYQQIMEQVKAHVAVGHLAPNAPLPSVRQLAADLGINVNTVVAAYRALEAEGIILLRHGSRARVHPRLARPLAGPAPADLARLRAQLERICVEARLAGLDTDALRLLADDVFSQIPALAGETERAP